MEDSNSSQKDNTAPETVIKHGDKIIHITHMHSTHTHTESDTQGRGETVETAAPKQQTLHSKLR